MTKTWYDEEEDVLNIQLSSKKYWKSVALHNGVVLDLSTDGTIIAVEVLHASKVFTGETKNVLETATAH